jgi:carbon monoxide dehydrogenase subunit G
MQLHNECVIAAPMQATWAAIVDLSRIAAALPGASLEKTDTSGTYRGTMKIKFGPVVSEYAGTATLEEVDDDRHVAVVRIQGREVRGQGGATATIRNTLAAAPNGATHLRIDTELSVSGIAAQLGGGMIEEVSASLLGQFAAAFERELSPGASAVAASAGVLDVGAVAGTALVRRVVPIALYAVLLLAVGAGMYALGRRRP